MQPMALRALHTTLLAGLLLAALCAAAVAGGGGASSGAGPAASMPTADTAAAVQAEHRRQRRLCDGLAVPAVRAECLRQADRSRAQALAGLRAPAASGAQRPFSP